MRQRRGTLGRPCPKRVLTTENTENTEKNLRINALTDEFASENLAYAGLFCSPHHALRTMRPGAVVVGWGYGTYRTYGTHDYGTRGQGDCFVGDNGTMGQHHAPRTTHHAPRTTHCASGAFCALTRNNKKLDCSSGKTC